MKKSRKMKKLIILFVLCILILSLTSAQTPIEKVEASTEIICPKSIKVCYKNGGIEEISLEVRGTDYTLINNVLTKYKFETGDADITICKINDKISYKRTYNNKTESINEDGKLTEYEKEIIKAAREFFYEAGLNAARVKDVAIETAILALGYEFKESEGFFTYYKNREEDLSPSLIISKKGSSPTWQKINTARLKKEHEKKLKELKLNN